MKLNDRSDFCRIDQGEADLLAVGKFLFLLGFWFLVSGRIDVTNPGDRYLIGFGVAASAFVTYLAGRIKMLDEEGHPIHLMARLFFYVPWLFWEVVLANLDVAYRVWDPRAPIDPQLIVVPFQTQTGIGTVIYANSITVTPGTITIGVDMAKRQMLIHALTNKAAQGLLSGEMHERILKLEGTL